MEGSRERPDSGTILHGLRAVGFAGGQTMGAAGCSIIPVFDAGPATPRRPPPGARPPRAARRRPAVVLFNKPYGVLCQFSRRRQRPADARRLRPRARASTRPGRLDADSEGLVVLTADGALQARIADPRHKLREDLLGSRSKACRRGAARRARRAASISAISSRRRRASRAIAEPAGLVAARSADPRPQGDADELARARAAPKAGTARCGA